MMRSQLYECVGGGATGQRVWSKGEGVGKDSGAGKEAGSLGSAERVGQGTVHLQIHLVLSWVLDTRRQATGGLTELATGKLIALEDSDMDPCQVVLPKPKSLSITAGVCPLFLLCVLKMPFRAHIQLTPLRPDIYPTPQGSAPAAMFVIWDFDPKHRWLDKRAQNEPIGFSPGNLELYFVVFAGHLWRLELRENEEKVGWPHLGCGQERRRRLLCTAREKKKQISWEQQRGGRMQLQNEEREQSTLDPDMSNSWF